MMDQSRVVYLFELIQDLVTSEGTPEEKIAAIDAVLTLERRAALTEFGSWLDEIADNTEPPVAKSEPEPEPPAEPEEPRSKSVI
jgi:hypothetical protein